MSSIEGPGTRAAMRGRSLVPSVPMAGRPTGPVMQRGGGFEESRGALPAEVRMALTRMENQRRRATHGDVVNVFTVPGRVFFGLIPVEQQIRATEVPDHLARGTPVTVHGSVMEEALDVLSKRHFMLPRLRPSSRLLESEADLEQWVRQGGHLVRA